MSGRATGISRFVWLSKKVVNGEEEAAAERTATYQKRERGNKGCVFVRYGVVGTWPMQNSDNLAVVEQKLGEASLKFTGPPHSDILGAAHKTIASWRGTPFASGS